MITACRWTMQTAASDRPIERMDARGIAEIYYTAGQRPYTRSCSKHALHEQVLSAETVVQVESSASRPSN